MGNANSICLYQSYIANTDTVNGHVNLHPSFLNGLKLLLKHNSPPIIHFFNCS